MKKTIQIKIDYVFRSLMHINNNKLNREKVKLIIKKVSKIYQI